MQAKASQQWVKEFFPFGWGLGLKLPGLLRPCGQHRNQAAAGQAEGIDRMKPCRVGLGLWGGMMVGGPVPC
jgi:hypothetical protein